LTLLSEHKFGIITAAQLWEDVIALARKPRIHFSGATYHVISRGNNREWVFDTDTEKRSYLALIRDYKKRYPFELMAWVVMSNHAHMLIRINEIPLSKIMQGIQQSYTSHYNHAHKRTGHVFEQRYKAFLCHSESQMLETLHYIHYNPVRANLAGGLNYPFSSHKSYLSPSSSGITDSGVLLELFASNRAECARRYIDFMGKESDDASGIVPKHAKDIDKAACPSRPLQRVIPNVDISELVTVVAELYGVRTQEIIGRSRRRDLSLPRRTLIHFCLNHTRIPMVDVARTLGVSAAAVSKAARLVFDDVPLLSEVLARLEQNDGKPDIHAINC